MVNRWRDSTTVHPAGGGDSTVAGGQDTSVTARVLGIPKATLGNWIRAAENGELHGAGDRPVSAEQMELALL